MLRRVAERLYDADLDDQGCRGKTERTVAASSPHKPVPVQVRNTARSKGARKGRSRTHLDVRTAKLDTIVVQVNSRKIALTLKKPKDL